MSMGSTTKIFLNMASKNGSQQLVSLLQYMKNTKLDNPEILVQDEKIKKLDSIVTEVKESEEWESVSMSIYSVALERGYADGEEMGRKAGKEIGEKIGKEIGKETILIEQICKKLRKAKSLEVIADELERNVSEIEPIYRIAVDFAPDYNTEMVIAAWFERNGQR